MHSAVKQILNCSNIFAPYVANVIGTVGDSALNAQLAGVIGQNTVENILTHRLIAEMPKLIPTSYIIQHVHQLVLRYVIYI